jgi:hypothetical protein
VKDINRLKISSLAFINIVLIVAYQIFVFRTLGATVETDIYIAAIAIPQFILAVSSVALINIFVPIFKRAITLNIKDDAFNFGCFLFAVCLLLVIIFYFCSELLFQILLPGFDGNQLHGVQKAFYYSNIAIIFAVGVGFWTAYRFSKEQYMLVEVTGICSAITAFVCLLLTPKDLIDANFLCKLFLLRYLINFVLISDISYGSIKAINIKKSAQVFYEAKSLVLTSIVSKNEQLADKFVLSAAAPGVLSLFTLAHQLNSLSSSVVSKGFVNDSLGKLSISSMREKRVVINATRLRIIVLYMAFLSGLYWLAEPLLGFLLLGAQLSSDDINKLVDILILISGIFFGGLLGQLAVYQLLSLGLTKNLLVYTIITAPIYLVLKFYIFSIFGIIGFCICISIIYLIDALALNLIFNYNAKKTLQGNVNE